MIIFSLLIWLPISIIITIFIITISLSYVCYRMIFFLRKSKNNELYPIPPGEEYIAKKELMIEYMKYVDSLDYKEASIKSFDGLILKGKYYECEKNAPIEIMVHGYKGNARRDLSGGVVRAFKHKRNVLLIDNRGSGDSEGKNTTFGVNESLDVKEWVNYTLKEINPNAKIILTGISMGAATVMIASSFELPKNVVGVVADCGYTSTEEIIKKVIKDMKLPPNLIFPFVKLGALIFGHFKVDKYSPIKAMKNAKLPIIFFHGDSDNFVPCYMSEENYKKCITKKRLVKIESAGHGLCYAENSEKYLEELYEFFKEI